MVAVQPHRQRDLRYGPLPTDAPAYVVKQTPLAKGAHRSASDLRGAGDRQNLAAVEWSQDLRLAAGQHLTIPAPIVGPGT